MLTSKEDFCKAHLKKRIFVMLTSKEDFCKAHLKKRILVMLTSKEDFCKAHLKKRILVMLTSKEDFFNAHLKRRIFYVCLWLHGERARNRCCGVWGVFHSAVGFLSRRQTVCWFLCGARRGQML